MCRPKVSTRLKLGLVINPYAGIGGALALKGSDGQAIRKQALAQGAKQLACDKTHIALSALLPFKDQLEIYTASGQMGEQLVHDMGFTYHCCYHSANQQTEGQDTELAVQAISQQRVDLLLFAGGDGTARNVCAALQAQVPVLGVPAGVKIHSGVYGVTPAATGRVLEKWAKGELLSAEQGEVRDIDEVAFRAGKVQARYFGEMLVPSELEYVQAVKMGGKESDELVLTDIADEIIEQMEDAPDTLFVMGSGSTVDAIMQRLDLPNTLLGVDVLQGQQLLASDLTAEQLLSAIKGKPSKLVLTLIGGQGHILGRGNQQLSPDVVREIGRENLLLVATKTKLQALQGRPLIVDSGDAALDAALAGLITVITGYHDQVLYPIANFTDQA